MSWYYDSANTWNRRSGILVNVPSGSAPFDVNVTIPTTWDEFWATVDASGLDVRVTDADGTTLLNYEFTAFNRTTRGGTLAIDAWTPTTTVATYQPTMYLYWSPTTSPAADASTTTTITSALTGYLYPVQLTGVPVVRAGAPPAGRTAPLARLSKTTSESLAIAFDFRNVLHRWSAASAEHVEAEEITGIDVDVYLAAAAQASMVDRPSFRFQDGIAIAHVTAGSTGNTYTVRCVVTTVIGALTHTYEAACLLDVITPAET